MMAIALEFVVVVFAPHAAYNRGCDWGMVVRIWAALRFDDSVHARPSELTSSEQTRLNFYIRRFKTTGPGRGISAVTARVDPGAFLACRQWSGTGFAHFEELGGLLGGRLLLMPTSVHSGFRPAPVRWADEFALLKSMLGKQRCPRLGKGGDRGLGPDALLPPVLA